VIIRPFWSLFIKGGRETTLAIAIEEERRDVVMMTGDCLGGVTLTQLI